MVMTNKLLIWLAITAGAACGDVDAQLAPAYPGSNTCTSGWAWDEPAMYGDPSFWLNGGPFFYPQPLSLACLRVRR
jgi:hypothetical protein